MSNCWVKEENTVVLKFCFLSKFITKAKISNRERKENETKRDIISSKCKKYLTSQKSKWLNWDMLSKRMLLGSRMKSGLTSRIQGNGRTPLVYSHEDALC